MSHVILHLQHHTLQQTQASKVKQNKYYRHTFLSTPQKIPVG
jgi:hypothetical protein